MIYWFDEQNGSERTYGSGQTYSLNSEIFLRLNKCRTFCISFAVECMYLLQKHCSPAEPGFHFLRNAVDPDQLTSDKAHSVLHSY